MTLVERALRPPTRPTLGEQPLGNLGIDEREPAPLSDQLDECGEPFVVGRRATCGEGGDELNETLRDDYIVDCRKGVERWNRTLSDVGAVLRLPHAGFNRSVGTFACRRISPDGRVLAEADWQAGNLVPNDDDKAHVESLMIAVHEPGKMAGWVAPPSTGIHQQPADFEYLRV